MSCGVGGRLDPDPVLLRLWLWLAAVAPIQPLAWELPYATDAALKRQKTNKQTKFRSEYVERYIDRKCQSIWLNED